MGTLMSSDLSRRVALAAWCGVFLALVAATGARPACADVYRFDSEPRLSISDLARLRSSQASNLGHDWVAWTPFDPMPGPEGGWTKLALVAAGEDGAGVTSRGGVLWTRRPEALGTGAIGRIVQRPGAVEVIFEPIPGACPGGFVFRLQADGVVSAGGVKLGSTRGAP